MTWDLSKLYASFDAPEFLNDVEELKAAYAARGPHPAGRPGRSPSVPACDPCHRTFVSGYV